MIGFLVRGRARIKIMIRIRVRVRAGVTFNVSVYHWSNNCRRSKRRTLFPVAFKLSIIFVLKIKSGTRSR